MTLYIKAINSLSWGKLNQDKSMLIKSDWKSIAQAMLPMIRMTNPFKQIGELEVSNRVNNGCKLNEFSYVVENSSDRLRAQNSVRIFKSVGNLKVNDNVTKWNSGNPDYRKVWGFGRLVVRNFTSFSEIRKESSPKANLQSLLSGEENVKLGLYNLKLKGQNFIKTSQKVTGLSSFLSNPIYLATCYRKIWLEKETIASGLNKITFDSIDERWFLSTSKKILNGSYRFSSYGKESIPKSQDSERSFAISNLEDKIIQEAIKILLEILFAEQFHTCSHGSKPSKNRYTALADVKLKMKSARWFIKGDLSKCYDQIDHNLLVSKINRVVKDQPFVDMIYKIIRRSYKVNNDNARFPKIGISQNSALSPILFNIFLHDFDSTLLQTTNFSESKKQKINSICGSNTNQNSNILVSPAGNENPRKIAYIRYADTFLVGIKGSKKDCVLMQKYILDWFKDVSKLNLSLEKIKISHPVSDDIEFLGCKILVSKYKGERITRRGKETLIYLSINAPIDKIISNLAANGFCKVNGNPISVGRFIHKPLHKIIRSYKKLEREIFNFYSSTTNYIRVVPRIHYILKYSCALTFASKLKLKTLKKVFSRFGNNLTITSEDNKIIENYQTPGYQRFRKSKIHQKTKNVSA
uniref:Maturase n=1 Tax=Paralemanea sp. TaxID=2048601 RepID=A0A343UY06_9FLOR|nr:maturase [Paralemanea sp.]